MSSDLKFSSGIAKFKAGFGGEYIEYYNCKKAHSLAGRLILSLKK